MCREVRLGDLDQTTREMLGSLREFGIVDGGTSPGGKRKPKQISNKSSVKVRKTRKPRKKKTVVEEVPFVKDNDVFVLK